MKARGEPNPREIRKQTRTPPFRNGRRLTTALDFCAPTDRRRSRTPLQSTLSLWHFLLDWQTKIKTRAASISVFGCNGSAMSLYNRAHNGKAHSQSFLLRGEELLEK